MNSSKDVEFKGSEPLPEEERTVDWGNGKTTVYEEFYPSQLLRARNPKPQVLDIYGLVPNFDYDILEINYNKVEMQIEKYFNPGDPYQEMIKAFNRDLVNKF